MEIKYFISPDGNDAWSGRLPEPDRDRSDGPFATLVRARQALRELKSAGGLTAPVQVCLRRGKYILPKPFVLFPQDSGTQDCPITYAACEGERVVIGGGRQVTGWQRTRGNIWSASLPGSRGGKWKFRQLFFNGKRQTRARFPRYDADNPLFGGWAQIEGALAEEDTTAFIYPPGTFSKQYANPSEIEVVYWANVGGWCSRVPLKDWDVENRILRLVHGGWQFDIPGWYQRVTFTPHNRFYLENALEDVQQPGDWCFDSENGTLYFYPPGGEITANDEVVVPKLDCLFDLRGASWINLQGFSFTETADGDNFHHFGVEGAGAMAPRPGWAYGSDAIHMKDTQHCTIQRNLFDQVGCNGIYLEGDNARNRILRNEIDAAGANGICLMGSKLKHPRFNQVSDNDIHHCGVINKYTAGIFSGMSDGNIYSHNRIQYMPHHAINLSNSPFGRNIVEYNEIHYADQEVNDSTAINCWMEEPNSPDAERCGHIIRYNLITDVYGCEVSEDGAIGRGKRFPVSGIYLDNYTSNCVIFGNIIARTATTGIIVHAGKNNLIENNIIADCPESIRLQDYVSGMPFWARMTGFMTGNHILHNVFYQNDPTVQPQAYSLYAWTEHVLAQCDRNLFYRAGGGEYAICYLGTDVMQDHTIALAEWQRMGYDGQTLREDPLFRNPIEDDFHLEPSSPLLELGFTPIPLERIGIRNL